MRASGRVIAGGVLLLLVVTACSNATPASTEQVSSTTGGGPTTTASAANLRENVPRPGVKGVTDSAIRVAAITSKTNPIGGKYHQLVDGINAYFKTINDAGGIYGRKLEVTADRDDQIGLQNAQQTTASLADDNTFATFEATLQFTGADQLAQARQPTFVWNLNPEFASTPTSDHSNIFGNYGALCFTCNGPLLSWAAEQSHFTKAAILAYGVASESKACAQGIRDDYAKYAAGKVNVVFFDDTVPYAGDLAADVARMKSAGVEFVSTCLDTNEVLKLAREMKKQGLHAVQNILNAYDHDLVKNNAALLQGDYVWTLYTPWESRPQSPATRAFLSDIKAVTHDPVETTEIGWILAEMFVDALKGAGPQFTQQKVIDWLNAQTAYDAGGLIEPINWTTGHIDPQTHPEVRAKQQCQPVLRIQDGAFVPAYSPSGKPWVCVDTSKNGSQTPTFESFAPGGTG